MTLRRTVVSLLLTIGALALSAAPALAHTTLKSSNPAPGGVLDAAPAAIELTFTGAVSQPTVTIPSWTLGTPAVAGTVVTVPVTASSPGAHTITWKVVSDDGDPVTGTIPFTLSGPPTTTTTTTEQAVTGSATNQAPAAQPEPSGQGFPLWAWIVIGAAVVAAAVGAVVFQRRRS